MKLESQNTGGFIPAPDLYMNGLTN